MKFLGSKNSIMRFLKKKEMCNRNLIVVGTFSSSGFVKSST